jgi:DNA-binding protein HU-beta
MNKAELVARIAGDAGLTKSDALKAVDALLDVVTKALKKGDKVTLVGFGTFVVSKRKARAGRNPQTGEPLKIPARRAPRFAAGKELKDALK